MPKPRVLVFGTAYHPLIGGAEIAIQEVVKRLQDRFDFYILTHQSDRALPRREDRDGARVIRLGFGTKLDQMLLFPFLVFLRAFGLVWGQPRVILWGVMVSYASIGGYFLKRTLPRLPFLLTLQEGDSAEHLASGRFGLIRFWWTRLLRSADQLSAISTYLEGQARLQGYQGPVVVIPNGVDLQKFKAQSSKSKRKRKNSNIIITTSRLVPKNGVDILIRAIAEVRKTIPTVRCHIIGSGSEEARLKLQAKNYQLQSNITFFGSVPHSEIPKFLHEADVFVRPSRSEGMGNSFVEALAAGLPIIGTPVGGILDIIQDGKTGLFARPEDPHDLAEKIIELLADPKGSRRLVWEGQAMLEERFSWEGIADAYAKLLCASIGVEGRPRVLMLSSDPQVLVLWSEAQERMGQYATLFSELHLVVLSQRPLPSPPVANLFFYPTSRPRLLATLARLGWTRRLDVMSVQAPDEAGFLGYVVARLLSIPFHLQIHTDIFSPWYRRAGWKERARYWIARFLVARADGIRVVSERIKRGLLISFLSLRGSEATEAISREIATSRQVGTRDDKEYIPKITVLPIFTDVSEYLSAPPDPQTEERFQEYEFKMIAVGRFVDKEKNFSLLIEMMREFVKVCPNALLVLVGDGPDRERYKLQTTNYKLERNILLEPWRDDLPSFLKSFDLFLLSSNYEGWGRVVIEAMAAGLPVVMTDVGLAGEVVRDGENGVVVPVGNGEEFSKSCQKLYHDRAQRIRLARAAVDTIRRLEPHTLDEYLTRYQQSFLPHP